MAITNKVHPRPRIFKVNTDPDPPYCYKSGLSPLYTQSLDEHQKDRARTQRPIMASASLRAKQGPLKDSYRSNPASALVTLSSTGTLDATSISCKLSTGAAARDARSKIAGLHPSAGGDDPAISGELCSGDMLLEALVACAGVTLKAVATAMAIPIVAGTVTAEGDLDFRGTMGVDREAPVGFMEIRVAFEVTLAEEAVVEEAKMEKLGQLTERYCVVLQTIARKPVLRVSLRGSGSGTEGVEKGFAWSETK
ncbi:hypothetical protein MMC19_004231 [Ptychographa xylographoides]|nr:hypothetical protein [Ptychographa xylographoides]